MPVLKRIKSRSRQFLTSIKQQEHHKNIFSFSKQVFFLYDLLKKSQQVIPRMQLYILGIFSFYFFQNSLDTFLYSLYNENKGGLQMRFVLMALGTGVVAATAVFDTFSQILNLLFITVSNQRHCLLNLLYFISAVLALLVILK